MRTYADLLEIVRREVVTEDADSGGFDNADDLYPMLYNSASAIAAALGFPIQVSNTLTLAAGTSDISVPANLTWAKSLAFYGDELELVPYHMVRRKLAAPGSFPRFYSHDPRRMGVITVAPVPLEPVPSGAIVLEYVELIDVSALTPASTVWGGLFPDFQHIVALHAGVAAWDSVGEAENAQYFSERFMKEAQLFAARFGVTDLSNLLVQPEQRRDRGEQ